MESIRNFILFYILIGFLMQILGDSKMSRYVRFFSGVTFLLILMAPMYQWITKKDVAREVSIGKMWNEYNEARNYDLMLSQHEGDYTVQASEVLLQEFRTFFQEKGYDVTEYEVFWDGNCNIEKLYLYVRKEGEIGVVTEITADKNEVLTTEITEAYEPDFEIWVYGK